MNQEKVERLGVVIATTGRREIVAETVRSVARLNYIPKCFIVVGAEIRDLPELNEAFPFEYREIVSSTKGSSIQRNEGMCKILGMVDFISFLDDDMELHCDYFREVVDVFLSDQSIAGFSGAVLANGNIDRKKARGILDNSRIHEKMPAFEFYPKKWPGFYGCNMNIKTELLKIEKFDERLPLYSLGEDCEMGFRLSRYGYVGGSGRCQAVHLAVSSGRISEVGFGYAQIVNYLYFAKKDIGFPKIITYYEKIIKTPIINLIFMLLPFLDNKKNIDRSGRLKGNLLAIKDLITFKLDPMNLNDIVKK